MAELHFGVLGPIEVRVAGRSVKLGTPKQRTVLATLLTRANTLTTHEQLVEELWPVAPPASAVANLRSYIGGLRQALPPTRRHRIESRPRGYAMVVEPGELDLLCFDRWAAAGRCALAAGQLAEAAAYLERAAGLWRGSIAEDLKHGPRLSLFADWLDERRRAFTEDLFEIRLLTGDPAQQIPTLRSWVYDHPLRDKGWRLLMTALYRSGDRPAAVQAYAQARQAFVAELGVEPSDDLQNLHRILLSGGSVDVVSH